MSHSSFSDIDEIQPHSEKIATSKTEIADGNNSSSQESESNLFEETPKEEKKQQHFNIFPLSQSTDGLVPESSSLNSSSDSNALNTNIQVNTDERQNRARVLAEISLEHQNSFEAENTDKTEDSEGLEQRFLVRSRSLDSERASEDFEGGETDRSMLLGEQRTVESGFESGGRKGKNRGLPVMPFSRTRKSIFAVIFSKRRSAWIDGGTSVGIGEPSLYHALIIIFLEFFSWGLLTVPIINVLAETFPQNKFLMNGLILGVKGLLSFLSAPLIGALSDIWGRKFFLLLTVFCTCIPIPWLRISPWWYFALFSISGVFSVTFSVVLAYVADITDKEERNTAYGLVSATFGASLITSPALGAWLGEAWSDEAVVALATAIAALDVFFILAAVPESLPTKLRHSWDRVTWESADPFQTLKFVGEDQTVLLLCIVVFLSYLPEAGQFSCFFVYLKLVVGFSPEAVAAFIGLVGILSVLAQTGVLTALHQTVGPKLTITLGLIFQVIQLAWYGLGTKYWMMWSAGFLAAMSQITYPAVSSFVSVHTDRDKQGTVQGIVTGIRGLCTGLGPALFGFIFYLFNVDLNVEEEGIRPPFPAPLQGGHVVGGVRVPSLKGRSGPSLHNSPRNLSHPPQAHTNGIADRLIPGPPFLFGSLMVMMALVAITYLPANPTSKLFRRRSRSREDSVSQGAGGIPLTPNSPLEGQEDRFLEQRVNSAI